MPMPSFLIAIALTCSLSFQVATAANAASATVESGSRATAKTAESAKEKKNEKKRRNKAAHKSRKDGRTTPATTGTTVHTGEAGGDDSSSGGSPVITAPSSLIDLSSARFGKFEVALKDAGFLEAQVGEFRLSADRMDMNTGELEMLAITITKGEFQHFTIDHLTMSSAAALKFDSNDLLNNKILQFKEPATAQVRAVVSQHSLNDFLNSPEVLTRLSGSAKKRLPILSTLARQDVTFGFQFLGGKLIMKNDNTLDLKMDSKLGVGKVGMPVELKAETKITLEDGWVKLNDTRLLTSGQTVPKDMASKIINRINSLSKWGTQSDDIQFQFTDVKVVPGEQLELAGTASIKRLRLTRQTGDAKAHNRFTVPGATIETQPAPLADRPQPLAETAVPQDVGKN